MQSPQAPQQQPMSMQQPVHAQQQPMGGLNMNEPMGYRPNKKFSEKIEFGNLPYTTTVQTLTDLVGGYSGFIKAYLNGARGFAVFSNKKDADACILSLGNLVIENHNVWVKNYVHNFPGQEGPQSEGGYRTNPRFLPRGGYNEGGFYQRHRSMGDDGFRQKIEPYPNSREGINGYASNPMNDNVGGYGGMNNSRYGKINMAGGQGMGMPENNNSGNNMGGGMGPSGPSMRQMYPRYHNQSWNDGRDEMNNNAGGNYGPYPGSARSGPPNGPRPIPGGGMNYNPNHSAPRNGPPMGINENNNSSPGFNSGNTGNTNGDSW